ncbi:MAG: hypothetical protein U0821_01290 [Chloroflexota bacterium]
MAWVRSFIVVAFVALLLAPLDADAVADRAGRLSPGLRKADRLLVHGRSEKREQKKEESSEDKQSDLDGNPRNADKGKRFGDERKEKEEEKAGAELAERNSVKTNRLGLEAFEIQGHVDSLHCKRSPKEIVIRTVDGLVTLRQMPEKAGHEGHENEVHCDDLKPGDYVFVHEAEKQHEFLYDAYEISCTGEEDDETDDNGNENDEPDDPNCRLLLSRIARRAAEAAAAGRSGGHAHGGHGHGHAAESAVAVFNAGEARTLTTADGVVSLTAPRFRLPRRTELAVSDLDSDEEPPTPGPNVGALFMLEADDGKTEMLPGALSLAVAYRDADVRGLDESRVVIAWLDPVAKRWASLESTVDQRANTVIASVNRAGKYAAYVRPSGR